MTDRIVIEELELEARIGIEAAERATSQRLTVNLVLEPVADFSTLGDRIENAVDYAAVCGAVQAVAASSRWHLLESLGEEIASRVLAGFAVRTVELELRKYILPETRHVAIRLSRSRIEE